MTLRSSKKACWISALAESAVISSFHVESVLVSFYTGPILHPTTLTLTLCACRLAACVLDIEKSIEIEELVVQLRIGILASQDRVISEPG
jgi:hypothetical protein